MLRRLGAAVIGLALLLPLTVTTVVAHGSNPFVINAGTVTHGDGVNVVGTVTNHTNTRQANVQVTATYRSGSTVVARKAAPALITNLAPHASAPFNIVFDDPDLGSLTLDLTASGTPTLTAPVGGLHVEPGELTGNVYVGTVTNDGATAAQNVRVAATREQPAPAGPTYTGAAGSAVIPTIAPGATAEYTIDFTDNSSGDLVLNLIAQSTTGAFFTSWNNYFGDLGQSIFMSEIAWLGDEGVTAGCAQGRFCPQGLVTRAEMAAFLVRALDLPASATDFFVDDETSFAEGDINALAQAGITAGCSATRYCPTQNVTREQMAAFLDRAYGFGETSEDFFIDDEASFAEANINRLAASGVTRGCTVDRFCPRQSVTREQMAAFIFRAETELEPS